MTADPKGKIKSFDDLMRRTLGRLDYCPTCGRPISVATSPTAEADFKIRWEAHQATHTTKEPTMTEPRVFPDLQNPAWLTKRERFALAAMQGMLANSADGGFATASLPKYAVDMADRMIDQLAKEAV